MADQNWNTRRPGTWPASTSVKQPLTAADRLDRLDDPVSERVLGVRAVHGVAAVLLALT